MTLEPVGRAGLERSRATAIAREHFALDVESATVDVAPFGVVVDAPARAVIVSSSEDLAVLGGVLVWSARRPHDRVELVVEHHAGVHARRLAVLAPDIRVHALEAGAIVEAEAAERPAPCPTPDGIDPLVAMIERSGADAVTENGIVRAEVAGLEVGRIVTGPAGSAFEVGVGRFDREAGILLHVGRSIEPTLIDTIDLVKVHRRVGAASHPFNRIGRERWLRSLVKADPPIAGIAAAELVEPVPPRTSLLETRTAALVGDASDGTRVLVVCTVGVDLGLVPEIVDLLAATGTERVVVVAPQRDHLPYLDRLLGVLPVPSVLSSIEAPWV